MMCASAAAVTMGIACTRSVPTSSEPRSIGYTSMSAMITIIRVR